MLSLEHSTVHFTLLETPYSTTNYSVYFNLFTFDTVTDVVVKVSSVTNLLSLLLSLCSRQRRQQKRQSEHKVLLSGFSYLCSEVDDSGLL